MRTSISTKLRSVSDECLLMLANLETERGSVLFCLFSYFCHLYQPGPRYLTCDRSAETGRTRTPNPFNFSVISWCYKRANQQWFPQHQETSLFSYLICDQSADIERENVLKNSSPLPPYSNLPTRPTPSSIYTAMTLYCLPNVIVMLGRQLPNILQC